MPFKVEVIHYERCIGCLSCIFACSRELFGVSSVARSVVSVKPSIGGESFQIAVCRGCKEAPCIEACPYNALEEQPEGGPTLIKPEECIKCKTYDCVNACTIGVMKIDLEIHKPIICTQCGECAKYCPHEVIVYREVTN